LSQADRANNSDNNNDANTEATEDNEQANTEDTVRYSTSGIMRIVDSESNIPITQVAQSTSTATKDLPHLKITQGNSWMPQNEKILFGAAFPLLYPYNQGHPYSWRPVPMSLEVYLSRILRCCDRRHARDAAFLLFNFDMLNRRKIMQSVAVHIRRNPAVAHTHALTISVESMQALLNHSANCDRNIRLGIPAPLLPPELHSDNMVMKAVTAATAKQRGGKEERKQMSEIVTAAVNVSAFF
jgi:hypothetical protein